MKTLIQIAVRRPVAVFMLTLALVIFGWRSLQRLETALLPDIEYPEYSIVTRFPGGSPEEIEQYITRPIEEVLSSLPGIQDIVSSSREGVSYVEAQFHWNIDFQFTLLRIREKTDAILNRFPAGTERPFILDFNPNSAPVMELAVHSSQMELSGLSEFTRDVLQPRFAQTEGIASALALGTADPVVQICLKPKKIAQYNLDPAQIINAIRQNLPGNSLSSRVLVGYAEYPLTVNIQVKHLKDFLNMPLAGANRSLHLGDIASIVRQPLPQRTRTYLDTTRVIGLNLYKEAGANTVRATQNAQALIQTLRNQYSGIRFTLLKDQGKFVRQSIHSLQQAIAIGALLAFLVLLLFLKQFRLSVILVLAIPVSLLVTFIALHLQHISLNIMSLGGLALGIGLIVDNGIVVTESVARETENPAEPQPALTGTSKVARAITGATITTIAIFFPIIYVRGYASVLFQNQALTLTYTLLISLFTSLTLLPTAIHSMIRSRRDTSVQPETEPKFGRESRLRSRITRIWWAGFHKVFTLGYRAVRWCPWRLGKLFSPVNLGFDRIYNWIESIYHRILLRALNHKPVAGILAFILMLGAFWAYSGLTREYWPRTPSRIVQVDVKVPTTVPYRDLLNNVQASIRSLQRLPGTRHVYSTISDPREMTSTGAYTTEENAGYYDLTFTLFHEQPITTIDRIQQQILTKLPLNTTHIAVTITRPFREEFASLGHKNFIVYVSGNSSTQLQAQAENVQTYLRKNPDCQNISLELGNNMPTMILRPQLARLRQYGMQTVVLADVLSQQSKGNQVGNWRNGSQKIPVYLLWESPEPKSLAHLLSVSNHTRSTGNIPLSHLVTFNARKTTSDIIRVNRKRVLAVEADVAPHRLPTVVKRFRDWVKHRETSGVRIQVAGESRRIAGSFRELGTAFILAVLLVYLILAAQFESVIHPFNIILTVPMGLVGAMFGLVIFQQTLNVVALIGIVMLIGIGVNDAIIKVDYINYLRNQENLPLREAILKTSAEKFRPVIMTSLTTIVAMLPLLFGLGNNAMNKPLAATIIGGLTFTTMLTLIYTPVLYELFEKIRIRVRSFFTTENAEKYQ